MSKTRISYTHALYAAAIAALLSACTQTDSTPAAVAAPAAVVASETASEIPEVVISAPRVHEVVISASRLPANSNG